MRVPKRRLLLPLKRYGFALAILLSAPEFAFGQSQESIQNSGPESQEQRRIEVNLIGNVAQFDQLEPLIPEWFGQDGLRVETRRQASLLPDEVLASASEGYAVRVWVTMANDRQARAYFSDPAAKRFLVRNVPLRDGLDEFGREQLVQILVASAEAFAAHRVSSSVTEVVRTFEGATYLPKLDIRIDRQRSVFARGR